MKKIMQNYPACKELEKKQPTNHVLWKQSIDLV